MAENVQWIKLKVGMFDGSSFKKIKRAKIGGLSYRDKLTAVWFELMDLAGKSNANGCLVDNNEIPYQSFEDISIMLDREEKEIELCMQFFINEKMIEIINDIYCLSNFMKYQNLEGLEKIREQKRIAQSKWREKQKNCLIDVDKKTSTHTSTHTSTTNLPSISISNSLSNINNLLEDNIPINQEECIDTSKEKEIFDYWNSKNIIKHKSLSDDIKLSIFRALKKQSLKEIKDCIERYSIVINDKNYFFDYKWSLKDFMKRDGGISAFGNEGSKWIDYQSKNKNKKKFSNGYEVIGG